MLPVRVYCLLHLAGSLSYMLLQKLIISAHDCEILKIAVSESRKEMWTICIEVLAIWWGEEPRIMDTFVESLSFDGIRMIPFCTSGSSGMGRSGKNLAENAGSGEWQDGKRFGAGASEDEIRSWIDSMK